MDFDVMDIIRRKLSPQMVDASEALPGRDRPVLSPIPRHEVYGRALDEVPPGSSVAYVAMGCFWGAEKIYWQLDGVVNTAVGYMGGFTPHPTYRETCTGRTGHTETVRVVFDPKSITYDEILATFWEYHDPTQLNRQGNDLGTQYRSAIFTTDEPQHSTANRLREAYQEALSEAGRGEIMTEISPATEFYFAEAEHQQYLAKNPGGYDCHVRTGIACPIPSGSASPTPSPEQG